MGVQRLQNKISVLVIKARITENPSKRPTLRLCLPLHRRRVSSEKLFSALHLLGCTWKVPARFCCELARSAVLPVCTDPFEFWAADQEPREETEFLSNASWRQLVAGDFCWWEHPVHLGVYGHHRAPQALGTVCGAGEQRVPFWGPSSHPQRKQQMLTGAAAHCWGSGEFPMSLGKQSKNSLKV